MRRWHIVHILWPILAFSSCDHKELCWDHDAHRLKCMVEILADYEQAWEYTYYGPDWQTAWPADLTMAYDDLRPALPDGLRVQDYTGTGGAATFNLDPDGGKISFAEGIHSLLFYNNGTQYIVFDEMASFATARASTRTRTRASYLGSPYTEGYDEQTVNAPDMLYGHYIEEYELVPSLETQLLEITLRPLVFTYYVRYNFAKGGGSVAQARGALVGMAKEVYLHNGQTSDSPATILYDCSLTGTSGAEATVSSFGIPGFPNDRYSRSQRSYGLNLEVMLVDGTTRNFDFDITDQVATQPRGGVITVGGIELPEVEPSGSGSLFTVDVIDWGPSQDIYLPL